MGVVWQDESYEVAWIDSSDLMQVWRKLPVEGTIGRIGPEVVAVASDEKFLTARVRRPSVLGISDHDEYYYIEKARDSDLLNGDQIAVGPMGKADFEGPRDKLHLPEAVAF